MATLKDAYQLIHKGSIALAKIESNGIRIDTDYLEKITAEIDAKVKTLEKELREDKVFKLWRKEYGEKTNLGSRPQLAHIIFDLLKYPVKELSEKTQKPKFNKAVINSIDLPFVKRYQEYNVLKDFKTKSLDGLKREMVDGVLYPNFNLHTVSSYRSSSGATDRDSDEKSWNFQNIPSRNAEIARYIRRCFIPRKGRKLVENDFAALEFRIAAAVWKDPEMIAYASNPKLDIHRDMAAELFLCDTKEVSKQMRYVGKNGFVFPVLYGSYYVKISQAIWHEIDNLKLTTVSGVPVKEWMKKKGIKELGRCDPKLPPQAGTYEYHVKQVESRFFRRFHVFAKATERWIDSYRRTGKIKLVTGFECAYSKKVLFTKNELLNFPIQGPGFHCLLWVLITMVDWVAQQKMKTKVVGQVHDCLLSDVPDDELQDYLNKIDHVVSVELPKAWKWICVPLEIEAEVAEGSWDRKTQWVKKDGLWKPKE